MPRRRSRADDGSSMDSLMDALTNVVAVLILVLVLVQADVTKKVVQFLDDLVPVSAEELAAKEEALLSAEITLEARNKLIGGDPPSAAEIESMKRKLTDLDVRVDDKEAKVTNLHEISTAVDNLQNERKLLKEKTATLNKQIATLEKELSALPDPKAIMPTEVSLPESRPIPESADIYYALVFNNQVHLIDPITPKVDFDMEFRKHERKWIAERTKRHGKEVIVYHAPKIMDYFKNYQFRTRPGHTVKLIHNPVWTRIQMRITPGSKSGISEEEMLEKKGDSAFAKAMQVLARKPQAVVVFWVNPNSFETYLVARQVADWAGVPAGWQVRWDTSYTFNLPDLTVKRLKAPAKPDPNAPPKPKKPDRLKPKLD